LGPFIIEKYEGVTFSWPSDGEGVR